MVVYERKIDRLGRVVLPTEIRQKMNVMVEEAVRIIEDNGKITIERTQPHCQLCGSTEEYIADVGLCNTCIKKIKKW